MKMALNISEAIVRIRKAGAKNVRTVPMEGQDVRSGNYCIEVKEGSLWVAIVEGLPKQTMDDIVAQATNRVILG